MQSKLLEEVESNLNRIEKLLEEMRKKEEEMKRKTYELMKKASRLGVLEEVCVKIGRSCRIEACYKGVKVSRGVLSVEEGRLILYSIEGCNVEIVEPDVVDIYEGLTRLKELSDKVIEELEGLLHEEGAVGEGKGRG